MTSRLDRLLSLLSNGDSLAVKRSAATQIGQIVGTHPKEVESILSKLKKHVVHSSWDVRIACGLAIELISQHISSEEQQSNEIPVLFCQCSRHGLKLDTFDLSNIIVNNASLYLGARKMDELGDYDGNVSVQKSFVRKEFNFGLQERLTGTIMPVEENDFKIEQFNNNNNNSNVKCISSSDLQRLIFGESYAIIEQDPSIEPASKRVKSSNDESRTSWSLSEFFDWLVEQSFQPEWEYRHGAVTAIRDLLKGQQLSSSSSNNNEFYLQWLEDLSVRLLTLMVLDRFADYVSDEVVAPIRETTAQTLSIICHRFQSQKQCVSLLKILLHLLEQHQNNWEIRHGTLLTLKYTFTILKDVPNEMRIPCIQTVRKCLADTSDDVVAAAAATLLPLVSNYEKIVLDCAVGLISELITLLDAMDDLNSAASSIMDLLAKLLALDSAEKFKLSFAQVLPKIFPFCRHHTQSFRLAAIQTVVKIIEASQAKFHACTSDELSVLEHTFRLLFERSILESDEIILSSIEQAWNVLCQSISIVRQCTFSSYQRWICLAVHPAKVPINPALLLSDEPNQQTTSASSAVDSDDARYVNSSNFHQYLATGFSAYHQETSSGQDRAVIKCRRLAARLLGRLFRQYDEQQSNDAIVYLTDHLNYRSATHRMVAGMIASEWARNFSGHRPEKANALQQRFISTLNETIYFDEIAPSFTKLKRDFTSFMHECVKQQLCNPNSIVSIELPSVDYIIELCNNIHENIVSHAQLNGQKQNIYDEAQRIQTESECLALRSTAYLASACIFWHFLGDQLNPLIRPLMDALKKETELLIQNDVSHAIAELIWQCTQRTTIHANPNSKIIKNLCGYVCIDSDETPHVISHTRFSDSNEQPANVNEEYSCTYLKGIYTWQKTNNDGPSRGQLTRDSSTDSTPTPNSNSLNSKKFNFELSSNEHTRNGGECALSTICRRFGSNLQLKLSELYDRTVISIEQFNDDSCQSQSMNDAQILADTLQILAILIPHVHETILHNYLNLLPNLTRCLSSKYTVIRFFTARCIGILSVYNTERVLQYVIDFILPKMINNQVDTHQLQGPIEALFHVIDRQALNIVPYAKHLMLPCIQCMTHQDWYIRSIASNCFAVLIKYYALHTDDKITQHSNGVESDGNFLEQLFDNTKVPAYQLPMRVQAEIRPYQYDGINWLMFLKRYNLSCVLADDMGLGKTLQTICVLASDIVERRKENLEIRPSLVIAPPTLIRHWTSEMSKFVGDDILRPLLYTGKNLAEREGLRIKYQRTPNDYTVIVVSYDIVRSDIGFFSTIPFNYCVLDEGHIIRNSKTKLSKAIRQISAVHRLILSGTPIQNNALELWKLFDFLMPGYLGSEKQFIRRYQKPLLASSRDRDLELGQLAMDVLHKQVKPFMLRRMKSDVLNDLPPKILQDYYCDLSSIQCMLYEDFTHQTKEEIHHGDEEKQNAGTHVFKALQYLRKLCNHPCLILTPQHPKWGNVQIELKESQMTLNDIRLSGKLLALKELLIECGIGLSKDAVVSTHRALVFCQMKAMVDVIITQVLGTMENVSYLRLDGSMSAADRFNTVNLFNADPSIDLLILTTHVGGLGLNLTGADTVIFVEHDWNPSKDLQAMDRAHRIGQKKVVNVYRLITRSTIEEKIMNLQRFKTNLADTVLASDNATSLLNLDKNTSLLDLISFGDETKGQSLVTGDDDDTSKKTTNYRKQSLQTILDAFSDSNDQDAYSDEYDLNKFCSTTTLKK